MQTFVKPASTSINPPQEPGAWKVSYFGISRFFRTITLFLLRGLKSSYDEADASKAEAERTRTRPGLQSCVGWINAAFHCWYKRSAGISALRTERQTQVDPWEIMDWMKPVEHPVTVRSTRQTKITLAITLWPVALLRHHICQPCHFYADFLLLKSRRPLSIFPVDNKRWCPDCVMRVWDFW